MATDLKAPSGEDVVLQVLSLCIHQKEGLKALCDIEVADFDSRSLPSTLDVWMDGVCQFRGQVTGVLKHFSPHTTKIELTQICKPCQSFPNEPIQFATPHEHLPVLPCYDRLTGEISETHLLYGKQSLVIDEKSVINYTSAKQPVPMGIDLCLEAKWRWQKISFFDLWSEIKTQCQGEFATLTPDVFVQKWQTALQVSPQSGYQVVYNNVSVQKPRFSSVFADKKRVKGGVIDGQCVMRATQEQKYHEVVQCSFGKDYPQRKHFLLKVPMTHYDETQFFETPTGKFWFERAYAIAHNYFLACNRQTRITLEAILPVDMIAKLTLDTQVAVGQRFAGKIVEFRISETASGRVCRLVLCEACPVEPLKIPALPVSKLEKTEGSSFVQDLDCQNLFNVQNVHAVAHKTGTLKLPVTAIYLQLRDLISKTTEPRVYQI